MRNMAIEYFKVLCKFLPPFAHNLKNAVVLNGCKCYFRFSNIVDIHRVRLLTYSKYSF